MITIIITHWNYYCDEDDDDDDHHQGWLVPFNMLTNQTVWDFQKEMGAKKNLINEQDLRQEATTIWIQTHFEKALHSPYSLK